MSSSLPTRADREFRYTLMRELGIRVRRGRPRKRTDGTPMQVDHRDGPVYPELARKRWA